MSRKLECLQAVFAPLFQHLQSGIVSDLVCQCCEQDTVANIMAYDIRITVLVKKAIFLDADCLKFFWLMWMLG